MKRILPSTIILLALAACTASKDQTPEPAVTGIHKVNMPNPASVFCEQNGNKLEIHTAADGSQNGVCVFPNGNTCDEWAYFQGECGLSQQKNPPPASTIEATVEARNGLMPTGTSEQITAWWGVIKSAGSGSQNDDYFERQDLVQTIYFGIDSLDLAVQAQIESLRDSGKIVHLYGTLFSNVPDYNGSQILVDRIEVEE